MKSRKLFVFLIVSLLLASIIIIPFKIIPSAFAHSLYSTQYMRYETHTINQRLGYVLNSSQSSSSRTMATTYVGANNLQVWLGIRAYILFSNNQTHELTTGWLTNVTRTSNGAGIQNVTFACSTHSLNISDALYIRCYEKVGSDNWTQSSPYANFVTSQLSCTSIEGTWTFSLYTQRATTTTPDRTTTIRFYWGTSTYNSRLSGIYVLFIFPPTYTNLSPADLYVTQNPETLTFKAKWDHAMAGETLKNYTFCWNNTSNGAWENTTTNFPVGLDEAWSNITETLNAGGGYWLKWQITAYNTGGGFNQTTLRYFYYWEKASSAYSEELGLGCLEGYTSVYTNSSSGNQAVFAAYINATSSPWHWKIRAFSYTEWKWTSAIDFGALPADDAHWGISIGFLPDGKLIACRGYYSPFYFNISTYSYQTETNLTKIISNWDSGHTLKTVKITSSSENFCYPTIAMYGNTTVVYGRDGGSQYGAWGSYRWVQKDFMDCWVYAFTNVTQNNMTVVNGDHSASFANGYINEWSDSYVYQTSGASVNASIGTFQFRSNSTAGDFYSTDYYTKAYLRINAKGDDAKAQIRPKFYNGTAWNTLSTVNVSSSYAWYSWEITSKVGATLGEADHFKLFIECPVKETVSTLTIRGAKLSFNVTGMGPDKELIQNTLAEDADGDSVYGQMHQASDTSPILYGFDMYNSSTIIRRNLYFIYSNDRGFTWKLINGTEVGSQGFSIPPVNMLLVNEATITADGNGQTTHNPIYNELANKVIFTCAIRNAIARATTIRTELYVYSTTLGSVGTLTRYNITDETGMKLFQNCSIWYGGSSSENLKGWYSSYYKRPILAGEDNENLVYYVMSPVNQTKFRKVWNNTDYKVVGTPGIDVSFSKNGPAAMLRIYRMFMGYELPLGGSDVPVTNDACWGSNFTSLKTGYLTFISWRMYAGVSGGPGFDIDGTAAIYNSTLDRIGVTSKAKIISGGAGNRWNFMEFSTKVSVTSGQTYWLMFNCSDSLDMVEYMYDSSSTNQTIYYASTVLPSEMNPASITYYKRKINIWAGQISLTIMGCDPMPPIYSNVGANTTIGGKPCKFYSYWVASALSKGMFSTNNTGHWTNASWTDPWTGMPTTGWYNKTDTLNSTHMVIGYRFYVNDSINQVVATSIYTLTTLGVYSYEFSSTSDISVSSSMLRALLRLSSENSEVISSDSYLRDFIRSLQETGDISSTLYKQAAIARLFSEATDTLSTFSSLAAYLRSIAPSLDVLWSYSQTGEYIRGFTLITETITETEILKELLALSMEVTNLETANGNATLYVWKAKQYSFDDRANSTDSYNNWKAKLMSNQETQQPTSTQEFYRALSYSNLETGSFSSQLIELKEIIVTSIENFETIIVTAAGTFDIQAGLSEDWQNGIVFGLGLGLVMGLSALGLYFTKRRRDE